MIIVSRLLTTLFSLGKAQGITLFPFIFLSSIGCKQNKQLVNHEKIHFRQAIELLVIPFYVIYIIEFIVRAIRLKSFHKGYLAISFEQEAYSNDSNLHYLDQRKHYQFVHYF